MGISREQALECFASDDLIGIGMEADAVRRRLHPENVVTYTLDARVDTSLSTAEDAVAEAAESGATGITLHGLHGLPWQQVDAVLMRLKKASPDLQFALLESEVAMLAGQTEVGHTMARLQQCGLGWIQGDAAATSSHTLHRAAHIAGLRTVASLCFGEGDGSEERVALLETLRELQDETGGLRALSLSSAPSSSGRELDDPTAVEYLKTLAISRMMLDNVPNLQGNWEQQGLKVLQMSLRFGANDAGSLMGRTSNASEEEVRRLIRDTGFKPVRRHSLYTAMFLD